MKTNTGINENKLNFCSPPSPPFHIYSLNTKVNNKNVSGKYIPEEGKLDIKIVILILKTLQIYQKDARTGGHRIDSIFSKWSPTFLTRATSFVKDNFSMDWEWECFQDDSITVYSSSPPVLWLPS